MGITSFAYRLVLLLHILSAIIGFGGVLLNGVYAARAKKRPPAEGLAVMEVNTFVSVKVAEIFIYLTAIWGLGLIGLTDKRLQVQPDLGVAGARRLRRSPWASPTGC